MRQTACVLSALQRIPCSTRGEAPGTRASPNAGRHECEVPFLVARYEQPADHRACDHHRKRNAHVEPDGAHRRAPSAAKKPPQPADETHPRAIDLEPCALHQRFEIGERGRIERCLARDREARCSGAVERGQFEQFAHRNLAQSPASIRRTIASSRIHSSSRSPGGSGRSAARPTRYRAAPRAGLREKKRLSGFIRSPPHA